MKKTFMALAPIRICDLGGWSDTWFAKRGSVLNIAVKPYAQCLVEVREVGEADESFFISVTTMATGTRLIRRTSSSESTRCLTPA